MLLVLFCLRVIGQLLVVLFHVSWLPPMEEWYSGLVPYGPLLAAQIVIVFVYSRICLDFMRGYGFFIRPRKGFAVGMMTFGVIYFSSMVIRYVVRMVLSPEERWFGGCIPIVFHWVLAAFLIVFALYHIVMLKGARSPE